MPALATDAGFQGITVVHAQGGDGASVDLVLHDGAVGGGGRPQGEADAGTETEASTNCSGPNSGAPGLVSPGP